MAHKFKPGDKVVYVNDFGVCWGVKTITSQEPPLTERGPLCYHYENSDTPWYPVSERNLRLADAEDVTHPECVHPADAWYDETWPYFQQKYGFTPTIEQLGGCY